VEEEQDVGRITGWREGIGGGRWGGEEGWGADRLLGGGGGGEGGIRRESGREVT